MVVLQSHPASVVVVLVDVVLVVDEPQYGASGGSTIQEVIVQSPSSVPQKLGGSHSHTWGELVVVVVVD